MLRPGPHREGEEPKPMMHERGKSDSAVRAVKPANKAERSAAELVEQRAGTKGKADQQSTRRAQERESVSQALGRIRQAAKQRKKEKFTTLFHHISVEERADIGTHALRQWAKVESLRSDAKGCWLPDFYSGATDMSAALVRDY